MSLVEIASFERGFHRRNSFAQQLRGPPRALDLPQGGVTHASRQEEMPLRAAIGDGCDVTVEAVYRLFRRRESIKGLTMVYEPKYLRFFQARFEPTA